MKLELEPKDYKSIAREVAAELGPELAQSPKRLRYTHQEAAEALGLTPAQLHGERQKGRIKGYRSVGRRWFYLVEDVNQYAHEEQVPSD